MFRGINLVLGSKEKGLKVDFELGFGKRKGEKKAFGRQGKESKRFGRGRGSLKRKGSDCLKGNLVYVQLADRYSCNSRDRLVFQRNGLPFLHKSLC